MKIRDKHMKELFKGIKDKKKLFNKDNLKLMALINIIFYDIYSIKLKEIDNNILEDNS
jgi:hypothetical protein